MKRILLLGTFCLCVLLPSQAWALVQGREIKSTNLNINYPYVTIDNVAAQTKINDDIQGMVSNIKEQFDSGKVFKASMHYQLKFEDDKYVSLTITSGWYNAGAAHGMYYMHGIVYDKDTGERIPFTNFVPLYDAATLNRMGADFVVKAYNSHKEAVPYYKLMSKPRRVPADYYLAGDGVVDLLFQPYELASYADGVVRIEFSREAIDYLNRINQ